MVRYLKLKEIKKILGPIREKIKEIAKQDPSKSKECEEDLEAIAFNSYNYKYVIELSKWDDPKAKKNPKITIGYSKTRAVLAQWQEIKDKYYIEESMAHNGDCQFEKIWKQEKQRKIRFYEERANATFWDLIPLAQYRLSLMSIFNTSDQIALNSGRALKLKNVVKAAVA